MVPAMSCKMSKDNQNWAPGGKSKEIKSKLPCIVEASESTRLRVRESLPNHHGPFCRKGDNSLQHHNLFGSQIYSYASSHENSRWTKNGKNAENSGVGPDKSQK